MANSKKSAVLMQSKNTCTPVSLLPSNRLERSLNICIALAVLILSSLSLSLSVPLSLSLGGAEHEDGLCGAGVPAERGPVRCPESRMGKGRHWVKEG